MKRIYIAGPIAKGDQFLNVRAAIDAATALLNKGAQPFVPHLSFSWHMVAAVAYERWMEWDLAWIEACHALLRLPGESPGADREVAFARGRGLPVFLKIEEALEWAGRQG